MDLLTAFGLFAVTAMLVCYALEDRSAWFVLAFAGRLCAGLGLRLPARRMAVGRSGRNPGQSWPHGAGGGSIGVAERWKRSATPRRLMIYVLRPSSRSRLLSCAVL